MRAIAMVEHNPDNCLLMQAMLGDRYAITTYGSGEEALEGLRERVPALVLLDISLPEMSGEEVLTRIRLDERLRQLPVVALTAHAMLGDEERFLRYGFDGYVSKPIEDESVLIGLIERLLAGQP